MKKALSFLLVLVMCLTVSLGCFTVSAAAEDTKTHPYTIEVGATEFDIGGQTYKVIRNVEEFKTMTSGYYILAGDIDFENAKFTSTVVSGITGDFILEGNGYSVKNIVLNFSTAGSIFGSCTPTVTNLTVESVSGEITASDSAVLFTAAANGADLKNVHVNLNITVKIKDFAGFINNITGGTASFTGCTLSGTIDAGTNGDIGGFVQLVSGGTTTFTDCSTNMDNFKAGIVSGTFVGNATGAAVLTYENCQVNGSITVPSGRVGGFMGYCTTTNNTGITFKKCTVSADFTTTTAKQWGCGGFVGTTYGDGPICITFESCVSKADMRCDFSGGFEHLSGFVGTYWNKKAIVSFDSCISVGNITSAGGQKTGGFVGQTGNNASASTTFNNCISIGTADYAFMKDYNAVTTASFENCYMISGATACDETGSKMTGVDSIKTIDASTVEGLTKDDKAKVNVVDRGNAEEGVATAHIQFGTEEAEGYHKVRMLFCVEKDGIVNDMKINASFKDASGKVVAQTEEKVTVYYTSVLADGCPVLTESGYVIVGFAVTDIPDGAYSEIEFSLVSDTAKYNASRTYTVSAE